MSVSHLVPATAATGAPTRSRRDQRGMLSRLMDTLDGMLFRCAIDIDWTMSVVSQGSLLLTGYSPEEFSSGRVSYELLTHPEDRQRVRQSIMAAVAENRRYQLEYRIHDRAGQEKWVLERGAPVCLESNETVLEGFIEDISERYALQLRMQQAELHYRSIFENSVVGMFQTSTDGQYLAANQALATLYKYDTPYELMSSIADIGIGLYVEPKRREEFKNLMQHAGKVFDFESEIYCRDGSRIWIAESAHAVHGPDGQILFYQGTVENVTERRQHQRELEHQATHDALTGLPNRNLLVDRLDQAIGHARRYGYFAAVVFIDLDNFKYINDSLGHQAGDALLIEIARRLQACLRGTDTVARYAGDEFVLVLNNYYQSSIISRLLTRLLDDISQPVQIAGGQELLVTCSIGVSLYPNDGDNGEVLLKNADSAMYLAKERGKSNVQFFTSQLNTLTSERLSLEGGLRRALERGEIHVAYQAKVDGAGRTVGCEALARWHSAELGHIPPDKFIPLAEEIGVIEPLTEFVLRSACQQAESWRQAGFSDWQMAVNLSARLFGNGSLRNLVADILAETGFSASHLELEITESLVMHDVDQVIAELQQLKALGATLAIDDFGTGYSSLSYLTRLPIDTLKIDKSFVSNLLPGADQANIAKVIVQLGLSLGLKIVAEGVETLAQRDFLAATGCHEYQGYLFAKPVAAEEFMRQALLRQCASTSITGTL